MLTAGSRKNIPLLIIVIHRMESKEVRKNQPIVLFSFLLTISQPT